MIFYLSWFDNSGKLTNKLNYIHKLSGNDKILSLITRKLWCAAITLIT